LPTGSAAADLLEPAGRGAGAADRAGHHRSQIWLIYLVIFLYGVIGSAIGPAQTALLPALVPEELLAQANGAQQTLNQGLRLVAPLLGAGLFALAGGAAVAETDAVTFMAAVASLTLLRVDEPGRQPGPGHRKSAASLPRVPLHRR
jgi:MFS family permease